MRASTTVTRMWRYPTVAAVALLVAATACGGPPPVASAWREATGLVALPGSVTGPLGALRVAAADGIVRPDASGRFTVLVPRGGPTQVDVFDAQGALVAIGFVDADDPASGRVDERTTALALLLEALGAALLPAEWQAEAFDEVASAVALGPLIAALLQAWNADPRALSNGSASLTAALGRARDAVLAQASSAVWRQADQARRTSDGAGSLLLIEPGADTFRSKALLLHADTGAGVVVQNHARRPAGLLVYRIEEMDPDGTRRAIDPPVQVGSLIDVPATSRLALLQAIGDVVSGNAPWTPETSAVVPLERRGDDLRTVYQAVLLGPSLDGVSPTPLLHDPRFYPFAEEWNDVIESKALELFFGEIALPLLETYLFGRVAVVQAERRAELARRVRALSDQHLIGLGVMLRRGDTYAGALRFMLDELVRNGRYRMDLVELVIDGLAASERQKASFAALDARLAARASAAAIVAAVEAALTFGDVAAIVHDLQRSLPADGWRVTAVGARVRLDPPVAVVSEEQRSALYTVTVHGLPDDRPVRYRWRTSGVHGTLHDDLGAGGTEFSTDSATVQYVATSAQIPEEELDTVSVEVRILGGDGTLVTLGTAVAVVNGPSLDREVRIQPRRSSVAPMESTDVRVVVDPPWDGGGLLFFWHTSGKHGTLFPAAGTLHGQATVSYTAAAEPSGATFVGTDDVHVTVYAPGMRPLGTASAHVRVEREPTIVPGSWTILTGTQDFGGVPHHCVGVYVVIPRIEGATSYRAHGYDFHDPYAYGHELSVVVPERDDYPPFPGWCESGPFVLGDALIRGLTGATSSGGPPDAEWYAGRFEGMVVDVEVTRP